MNEKEELELIKEAQRLVDNMERYLDDTEPKKGWETSELKRVFDITAERVQSEYDNYNISADGLEDKDEKEE